MYAYSFLDSNATIIGPGGAFNLAGQGSGAADEGITFEFADDKGDLVMGADGSGMHQLNASKRGVCTVRFLKNSLTNFLLSAMFNVQYQTSLAWGQNIISCRNITSGDVIVLRQAAFSRHSPITYGKAGANNEWRFNAIYMDVLLGSGVLAG
jgi:hypothetical protein